MKTKAIKKHHHRAVTYLNAFLREKSEDKIQLARLNILMRHYEKQIRSIKRVGKPVIYQEAA